MRRSIPIAACAIIMCLAPMFGQGPTLTGAGYTNPTQVQVAPGQIATLFASGLKTVLSQPLRATSLPPPNSLGGISVAVSQVPVPLLAVQQMSVCGNAGAPPPPPASPPSPTPECVITAITVQIPYEIATPQVGPGKSIYPRVNVVVTENGSDSKTFTITSVADKFHVLNTCDAFLFLPTNRIGGCNAVVTHDDGTVVTLDSPAKAGEVVVIYAFGLGATTATPKTGQASPTPAAVLSSFVYFAVRLSAQCNTITPLFESAHHGSDTGSGFRWLDAGASRPLSDQRQAPWNLPRSARLQWCVNNIRWQHQRGLFQFDHRHRRCQFVRWSGDLRPAAAIALRFSRSALWLKQASDGAT
jgi:hypothetical protein